MGAAVVGQDISARSSLSSGGLAVYRPARDPRGPKKDQTERTRLDSSGQMGVPFSEGNWGWTATSERRQIYPQRLRFPPPPLLKEGHTALGLEAESPCLDSGTPRADTAVTCQG